MGCETCKFNLKNEIIGFSFFVSKGINALPGRLRGFRNNVHSSTTEDQNSEAVQRFNGKLGTDRHGEADIVYDDLGNRAMSESLELNVAVSVRRRDGTSGVAKKQLRHYNEGTKKGLVSLKDGDNIAYLVLNGEEVTDGIGIAISTRNGMDVNSISRLLPDMTEDQVIRLFQLIAEKQGDLINLATDDRGVLYRGIKNVNLDLRSTEFVNMLNIARGISEKRIVEEKIEVKMLPKFINNKEVISPLFLMKTIPISDFKIEGLRNFRVVAYGGNVKTIEHGESTAQLNISEMVDKRQLKKAADVSGDERMNVEEPERTGANFAETSVEEEVVVPQATESFAALPIPSVFMEEKKAVLKSFEVPEVYEKLGGTQENVIAPALDVPVEKEKVVLEDAIEFCDVEKKEAVVSVVIDSYGEGVEAEAAGEQKTEERKADSVIVGEKGEDLHEDNWLGVDEETGGKEVEQNGGNLNDADLVFDKEVGIKDGALVVDYGQKEAVVETSQVNERAVFSDGAEVKIIFDGKDIVKKKPEFFGELVIPKVLVQKPKLPKVFFDNHIFPDELWEIETGTKMQFVDFPKGNFYFPEIPTYLVPVVLYWLSNFSL